MSRYIDAEALCKLARNNIDGKAGSNVIMRFPTANVQEVRREEWLPYYGKWNSKKTLAERRKKR